MHKVIVSYMVVVVLAAIVAYSFLNYDLWQVAYGFTSAIAAGRMADIIFSSDPSLVIPAAIKDMEDSGLEVSFLETDDKDTD